MLSSASSLIMEVKVSIRFIGICLQQCVLLLYCMQEAVKVMDGVRADIWGTFSTLLVLPLVEMGSYCWKTHTQWDSTHTLKGRIKESKQLCLLSRIILGICVYILVTVLGGNSQADKKADLPLVKEFSVLTGRSYEAFYVDLFWSPDRSCWESSTHPQALYL